MNALSTRVVEQKSESRSVEVAVCNSTVPIVVSVGAMRMNDDEWPEPTLHIVQGEGSIPLRYIAALAAAMMQAVREYEKKYGGVGRRIGQ